MGLNNFVNKVFSRKNTVAAKESDASAVSFEDLANEPTFEERAMQAERLKAESGEVEDGTKNEAERQKLELFNKFVDFFERDEDIKSDLVALDPKTSGLFEGQAVYYSDRLYAGTKEIIGDLKSIMDNFYQSETLEKRLHQIESDVVNAGADPNKLARVYQNDFAAMSREFNDKLHQELVGYMIEYDPHQFDAEAQSINEILHLIHSSIVNDEKLLHSLPVLDSKEEKYKKTVLYGTADSENPVAREIFDSIKDSQETFSDIVSLPDRTLMMVRDRGHALTLSIEKETRSGDYYVNYFVPKICNVDKVNLLPGVRRITKKEGQSQVLEATTGVFRIRNEADVATSIAKFIEMVPTDKDIDS